MLCFLKELLAKAWAAQLASLGTTGLAVSVTIAVFFVHLFRQFRREGWNGLKEHVRKNIVAGVTITVVVWLALFAWWMWKIVYEDHLALVSRGGELIEAQKLIEKKTHSLDSTDPAFRNMQDLVRVFMSYRRAIGYDSYCMVLFSAPADSSAIAGTVMELAVLGANCPNGNLLNMGVPPEDQDAQEANGMIPGMVVVHAVPTARGVNQLVDNLSNYIQAKRSYSMPKDCPENYIWLQFGPDVTWNSQLR